MVEVEREELTADSQSTANVPILEPDEEDGKWD
jgi:hypothetical protein